MKRKVPGLNVQWPISELLLSGDKTVETRKYPLPQRYRGVELAIIETPGPQGRKTGRTKAEIIGTIVFSDSFLYPSKKDFDQDFSRHQVEPNHSQFRFVSGTPKYGWVVKEVKKVKRSPAPKKRGIIYAKTCLVEEL